MTTLDRLIKLSFRSDQEASQLLYKLDYARQEGGRGALISGYYVGSEQKVYLSCPGCPIEPNETFPALSDKLKLESGNNYFFYIRQSALAKFAKVVVDGGPPAENDLLEYDEEYLKELNNKSLSALKTVIASAWAGDFVWALSSVPLDLGAKLAEGTVHEFALTALNLTMTIAFPILLGPLVGYVNYRAQIADYEAKYGVSPPPEMLRKLKHQSIALAFQVSCSVTGWTLAYEFAVPIINAIFGVTLASTPAYWLTVLAIGVLTAIFMVIACMITQYFLQKNNTAEKTKINYPLLFGLSFVTGALFILCFAIPGQAGMKGFLSYYFGMEISKIMCGLASSLLIGTSVASVSACYRYEENKKSINNDPGSHLATMKGFFGGNQQPEHGPRLAY
jgi:hypothetical protein